MDENEYDVDDNCFTCYFDEGVVRDEFHGECPDCGFNVYMSGLGVEAFFAGR